MRARKHLAAAVLALPLLAGMTACGGIQQAQEGISNGQQQLDKAQSCLDALKIANFTPSFSDPQQAQADAQAKVQEIQALADRTADQTLKQNLMDVKASVQQVADGQVTLENSADWVLKQLDTYQRVTSTCSQVGS